jgi:hypothetical protein
MPVWLITPEFTANDVWQVAHGCAVGRWLAGIVVELVTKLTVEV